MYWTNDESFLKRQVTIILKILFHNFDFEKKYLKIIIKFLKIYNYS